MADREPEKIGGRRYTVSETPVDWLQTVPYDLWDDELNRWRFPLRLDELLGPTTPHTLPEDLDREELWTLHSDELAEALDMDVVELLGS